MRPAVQVGNPFMEKLLMEACYEIASEHGDWVAGIQDLGAAGLTSSVVECCARGRSGAVLELSAIPRRETGMAPYEVMLSESQERMLLIAKREHVDDVRSLVERWELSCTEIGRVVDGGDVVLLEDGREVGRVPVEIATDPPEYRRKGVRPAELAELNSIDLAALPDVSPAAAGETLLALLKRPNIASKRGVFRQYDQQVLGNTVVQPGGDAAVLRVDGTTTGIAVATDCNARFCYLDPYTGGAAAVAEAARNIVCTGATPIAVTDCLNFGDPRKADVYFQLEQSVRGISRACERFGTPVVSGNVSLYNEAGGHAVYPTPVIGMLGLLEDIDHHLQAGFTRPGSTVFLLGGEFKQPVSSLAGSEYLEAVHGKVGGMPEVDLEAEAALQSLVLALHAEGLLLSAHDCSEGGLAVTVAESCLLGSTGFEGGERVGGRLDAALFGEAEGRILVSVRPGERYEQALIDAAATHSLPAVKLGHTSVNGRLCLGPLDLSLDVLREAYEVLLD